MAKPLENKINDPLSFMGIDFDTSMASVLKDNALSGEAITRILAACSTALTKLQFYNMMLANESSLLSARTFEAVSTLAFNKGYKYSLPNSATGSVRFSLGQAMDSDITLPLNTLLKNDRDLFYTTLTALEIPAGQIYGDIPIAQGYFVTETFVTQIDDQRILNLGPINFSESHLYVTINGIPYTKKQSIFDAESGEFAFELAQIAGEIYLIFGNGAVGNRLVEGDSIVVKYLITEGEIGNSSRNTVTIIADDHPLQVTITNYIGITGGNDQEDIESIRENAQAAFWTQWQITTAHSAIAVVKLHPYVKYANVKFQDGTGIYPYKMFKVYVSGTGGALSEETIADVQNYLYQRTLEDTVVEVENLKLKSVSFNIDLTIKTRQIRNNVLYTYSSSEIVKEIKEKLNILICPDNYAPESVIYLADVIVEIKKVEGVLGVIINDPTDDLELALDEIPVFSNIYIDELIDAL